MAKKTETEIAHVIRRNSDLCVVNDGLEVCGGLDLNKTISDIGGVFNKIEKENQQLRTLLRAAKQYVREATEDDRGDCDEISGLLTSINIQLGNFEEVTWKK